MVNLRAGSSVEYVSDRKHDRWLTPNRQVYFIVFLPQDTNRVASYLVPSRSLLPPAPLFPSGDACSHWDEARLDGGKGLYTTSLPFSGCPISLPLACSSYRNSRAFAGLPIGCNFAE